MQQTMEYKTPKTLAIFRLPYLSAIGPVNVPNVELERYPTRNRTAISPSLNP